MDDVKHKMSAVQIENFKKNAGLIIWDKAKAYAPPSKITYNLAGRESSPGEDSIVILPVVLPDQQNVNAALVANIYNNGDSIVYSTHYKNNFISIEATVLPDNDLTAREMYVLGMAQLDAEVFEHTKFIINADSLNFTGQSQSLTGGGNVSSFSMIRQMCEYTFWYTSATVNPPVIIYSFSDYCDSPTMLPPAVFLQSIAAFYEFESYSSVPEALNGGGGPVPPYQLEFSFFYNALNATQKAFLDNVANNEYYNGFLEYLILHQFTEDAKDHIEWCINYLTSGQTILLDYPEFRDMYLSDFPSLSFLTQADIDWLDSKPLIKARIYYYLLHTMALNMEEKIQFHVNKLRTDNSYYAFNSAYAAHSQFKNVWFSDEAYLYNFGGLAFGEWAINYLTNHPNNKIEVFQNQFMSVPEGKDGDYDANYWNDPNLTFPAQNLPSWVSFKSNYPKHSDSLYNEPEKLYNVIGGQVLTAYNSSPVDYQNTCALRISRALNYSGIAIPAGTNRYQGADGKYYFLSAAALLKWMKLTFGTPSGSNHLTGSQGGNHGENFPSLLANKKGIYIMTPNYPGTNYFGASGHADMIENAVCDGGCYFDGSEWGGIHEIFIWELP